MGIKYFYCVNTLAAELCENLILGIIFITFNSSVLSAMIMSKTP